MFHRSNFLVCLVIGVGCYDPDSLPPGDLATSSASEGTESGTLDPTASETVDPATSTSPTTGTDTTGPESCGGGAGLCVAVPDQWSGPVAVAEASLGVTPDCAGLDATVTASADLNAPTPTCACECSAADGASCSNALLAAYGDDAACASDTVFTQVIDTGGGDPCNFMPGGESTGEPPVTAASHWALTTASAGGSCSPQATGEVLPASYLRTVSGCAANELDMACDGGTSCFEAPGDPFAAGLCVWRSGTHECPTETFAVRSVHNRGALVDDRACSECSCGEATGSCPTSEAQLYDGYYCNGPGVAIGTACTEACVVSGCETYAVSSTVTIGPAEATCPPTGGEVTGELVEADPVTFCCTN